MDETTTIPTTVTTTTDPILKDTTNLCETLFNQLNAKFQEFFTALPLHHHENLPGPLPPPDSRLFPLVENLSLILRRSLVVLTLPFSDQEFLINKCRFILSILSSFLSVDITQLSDGTTVLLLRNFLSHVQFQLSDSYRPFLCTVLEVFADELLRHQPLRMHLMRADLAASSNSEKMFVCRSTHCDIASVVEVISAHFILSVSNEKAFENFISRLCLHCNENFRFPQLGLEPAMALLLDPVVYSAPKIFQAHVISLVSEVIGSGLSSENLAQDVGFYLMAFHKSVSLYSIHVASLHMDGFYTEPSCAYNVSLFERGHPTFESYIQERTSNRLNQVLSKSNNSLDSFQCKMTSKTKADLLAEYIKYMKGRQYIFADLCRDKAASFLDYIIHRTFSQDAAGDVLYVKQNTSAEDISLLASILKLMSVSLLLAIKCLSNSGDSRCLKTMGSSSVRDEYDFLISIINPFQQLKFCLPIQTSLYDMMKNPQSNYKVSKSMLVHFSGLLSLSFYNGFDVLARGCISVMMSLMSMFIFEEGDLVDLGSLRGLPLQSCSFSLYKSGEDSGKKRSIYKIAAEFNRIRTRNLRQDSIVVDGSEETCNGKLYLDCLLPKNVPDYGELADFIVCREKKDYTSWLSKRQIYRRRKYQKTRGSKKFKKERVWKFLRLRKLVRF